MKASVVAALTIAGALTACGADGGGVARTVTVTSTVTEPAEAVAGDAILIETRVTDARAHTGEVARGSVLGEATFCPGGTTSGGSDGPTITTTFRCRRGTLTVQYAPTQRSLVQGNVWEVVRGTGSFEGLRGGGSMVGSFDEADPDTGREVFTGQVGR